jgi:sugar fermentation stimulation protein A
MILPRLEGGRILNRYKRFFADVELHDGRVVTAHCPNTGSMESCWSPGAPAEVSFNDNPKRKLRWTLERVDMGGGWIGVNTGRVNAIVAEGISAGRVSALSGYTGIRREPRVPFEPGSKSRFDLELTAPGRRSCLVEIKNATYLKDGMIQFPDAVTTRGLKHLDLLLRSIDAGFRACMVFAVNRPETRRFKAAEQIDPDYASRLSEVERNGVEVLIVPLKHLENGIEAEDGSVWRGG